MVVGLIAVVALGASTVMSKVPNPKQQRFTIVYPDLSKLKDGCAACEGTDCAAEAAALAQAVAELEAMREVAEEAFAAWLACTGQDDPNPNPNPDPNPNPNPNPPALTVSILESKQ